MSKNTEPPTDTYHVELVNGLKCYTFVFPKAALAVEMGSKLGEIVECDVVSYIDEGEVGFV